MEDSFVVVQLTPTAALDRVFDESPSSESALLMGDVVKDLGMRRGAAAAMSWGRI